MLIYQEQRYSWKIPNSILSQNLFLYKSAWKYTAMNKRSQTPQLEQSGNKLKESSISSNSWTTILN